MLHKTDTDSVDNNQEVIELKVENLVDSFTDINDIPTNDSSEIINKPLSNNINDIPESHKTIAHFNNLDDTNRNVPNNNMGNKSVSNVTDISFNIDDSINNIEENKSVPSNVENTAIATIVTGTDLNQSKSNHKQLNHRNDGKRKSLFRFFHRQTKAANFNLKDEHYEQSDRRNENGRHGNAVLAIRFEKIDPSVDTNNNSEGIGSDSKCDKQEIGGVLGVTKKKMSDSEDDTRPIIRASRDPSENHSAIPEVQSRTPHLISWWTWIAYSQGHVYNDLCASMWFTYLMPYLQKCVLLLPSNAGLLMLIGQVADALATPVVGLLSDRGSAAWYCALGRRKSWHILGTIFISFSFPFIFSPIIPFFHVVSQLSLVLYYTPFICLFQFGWASAQIAHLSLVPDLTPNEHERTSLLSVRYAFTVISNLLVYVIMYIAVGSSSTPGPEHLGPEDSSKFQYISYIVVGIGYLSTIVFYAGVSEMRNRQIQLDIRQSTSSQMYEARKRSPRQLLATPTLYTVAVLYMTARMFFNILQMFIVFYVQDTLALSKVNIALVPLVILISGFITSLGVKQFNVRLGRKPAHLIGLFVGVLVSVIVFMGTTHTSAYKIYQVYVVAVLYGMSSTVIQVTSFGMAADFVGDDVSNGAFIYGILSFADKTSNGVVAFFIQKFNPQEGYYYRLALSYGCGIPCLVGILALIFLPPVPQVKLKAEDSEDDLLDNATVDTQVSAINQ